jgi:ribose 5-phosphate isomerase B
MKNDLKTKILFATDHAGFELKNVLVEYVKTLGFDVEDMGAHTFDANDDYPDFIILAAKAVSADPTNSKAIVLGGSGQGEAIVSNRFPGVRAVVYYSKNLEIIKLSREHNDANILSLGARFLADDEAKEAVKLWLETPFSGEGRHTRRINQIDSIS